MYSTTLRVDDRILVDCEVEPRLGAAVLVLPRRAGQNDTILKFQPKDVHGESAQSVAAHGLPIDYVWCLIEILLPQSPRFAKSIDRLEDIVVKQFVPQTPPK